MSATRGLVVRDLGVRYGGLQAVDGVSLDAPIGRITGLMVCQPSHAARISASLREVARISVICSMSAHVSGFAASRHHFPRPYHQIPLRRLRRGFL